VEIRAVLAACPFHSEGHRKVHFRLRAQGIRVGRKRVLRLMGEHRLLVPSRSRHEHGDPGHAGTIVTTRPDEMWGTDATRFYTERAGWCWFFGAVDHYTTEFMGWHVAKVGDRWAALEPIRQGMTTAFGSIAPKVALGVALRHDWGCRYTANTFVNEIKCWGFTDTPAFVGEPECNVCAERFMRTLKSLPPPVPRPRGGAADHRRVHRALRRGVDRGAPGVPDARPGASRCARGGRMRGDLTLGPVAARGAYSISVRHGSAGSPRSGPGVQETGCATSLSFIASRSYSEFRENGKARPPVGGAPSSLITINFLLGRRRNPREQSRFRASDRSSPP
jgi:putative transposase